MSVAPPRKLDATYEPLRELGRGARSRVYLAASRGAGAERFVVKRLHDYLVDDPAEQERFLDYARIAQRVDHPHVVRIVEIGRDEDGCFVVSEYIEGESLERLIERAHHAGERLPARLVARVLIDALAGLHAGHETRGDDGAPLGVLHHDVTPQNLLVGKDGRTRVSDFAKAAFEGLEEDGRVLAGKVLYLPPESADPLAVDRRLDIFALGVTAWVALGGTRPWYGEGGGLCHEGHLVPALGAYAGSDANKELVEVVMRACRCDRDERHPSAEAMARALAEAAEQGSGVASWDEVGEFVCDQIARSPAPVSVSLRPIAASVRPAPAPDERLSLVGEPPADPEVRGFLDDFRPRNQRTLFALLATMLLLFVGPSAMQHRRSTLSARPVPPPRPSSPHRVASPVISASASASAWPVGAPP